jgi:tetratricopeptide (TPR) repeat protein
MNFPHISNIVKVTLTTIPIVTSLLTWNINSAQASLDSQAIDRVNYLSLTVTNNTTQPSPNNTDLAANNRGRSLKYQQIGIEAHKAEDYETALENYYLALNLDPENGHVWLLAGSILGNSEEGIKCIRIAAQLFKLQGDREGYQAAIDLLAKFDAND